MSNLNSYINIAANTITTLGDITPGASASPAPSISGFHSISAVNLGASGNINATLDISAGGNLDIDGDSNIGGNLFVTGNINFSGNVNQISGNSGAFFGNAAGVGALYAGIPVGYSNVVTAVIQSTSDLNDYTQINAQNLNHGNIASMEYVITGDLGTDTTDYIDIGFSSSSWDGTQTNSLGTAVKARDGYMYVQGGGGGGNLVLGTTTSGRSIKFNVGGPDSSNTVGEVFATGLSMVGNVRGGNLFTTGVISASGNITGGNLIGTLANGNSNIAISANSSVVVTVGAAAAMTVSSSGVQVQGTGRLLSPGGAASITLNNNGANIPIVGVTNTGNSTSTTTGALIVSGGAGVAGNIYAGNVYTPGLASVTGNITGSNLLTSGQVSATGNVTGNYILGNGSGLTGVTVSVAGNIVGTSSNVTLVAGSYSTVIDNTGVATFPGIVYSTGNVNNTAFQVGNGAVSNCAIAMIPTAGIAGNYAIRDYSTANSIMYFDTTIGSANTGGSFQFRSSNAFTQLATVNSYGVVQPTKPAFRVYGTNGTNIPAGTTIGNTQGAVVDYNTGSYYNNATGIFTAPVAGIYSATATLRCGSTSGLNQASIQRNGNSTQPNVVAFWEVTGSTTIGHMAMAGQTKLAVGDTLRLQVLSGNVNFDPNDSWAVTFIG